VVVRFFCCQRAPAQGHPPPPAVRAFVTRCPSPTQGWFRGNDECILADFPRLTMRSQGVRPVQGSAGRRAHGAFRKLCGASFSWPLRHRGRCTFANMRRGRLRRQNFRRVAGTTPHHASVFPPPSSARCLFRPNDPQRTRRPPTRAAPGFRKFLHFFKSDYRGSPSFSASSLAIRPRRWNPLHACASAAWQGRRAAA
jgi:hypothetical protein